MQKTSVFLVASLFLKNKIKETFCLAEHWRQWSVTLPTSFLSNTSIVLIIKHIYSYCCVSTNHQGTEWATGIYFFVTRQVWHDANPFLLISPCPFEAKALKYWYMLCWFSCSGKQNFSFVLHFTNRCHYENWHFLHASYIENKAKSSEKTDRTMLNTPWAVLVMFNLARNW